MSLSPFGTIDRVNEEAGNSVSHSLPCRRSNPSLRSEQALGAQVALLRGLILPRLGTMVERR